MELQTRKPGTVEKVENANFHLRHTTVRDMVITTTGGMTTGDDLTGPRTGSLIKMNQLG
jgi:hypothetical protein